MSSALIMVCSVYLRVYKKSQPVQDIGDVLYHLTYTLFRIAFEAEHERAQLAVETADAFYCEI